MENNIENTNKDQISKKNILEDFSLKNPENTQNDISSTNYKFTNSSTTKEVVSFSISESASSLKKINAKRNRFPYCIVWTPIPFITYIIPSIGHTGIGTSSGIIHDFAGSYFISVDDFAFGKPTKYYQLDLNDQEKYEFDRAVEKADNKFSMEQHNLCFNNCHSHVACVLNNLKYKGKTNYTMIHIWWMLITKGKYLSFWSFFKTYIGFIILAFIMWMILRRK